MHGNIIHSNESVNESFSGSRLSVRFGFLLSILLYSELVIHLSFVRVSVKEYFCFLSGVTISCKVSSFLVF